VTTVHFEERQIVWDPIYRLSYNNLTII